MPDLHVISNFIAADIRMASPILFAALGLVLMYRSGLINIGCEGIMLMGSLMGFIGSFYFNSVWMGFLTAIAAGGIMGLLFAFVTVTLRANQIVIGAAFNILGSGLTATLFRIIFGVNSEVTKIKTFKNVEFFGLSEIPILGDAFFNHMPPVYIVIILAAAIWYFLNKTSYGLNLRATGENPKAADTLGVNVFRIRYLASIAGGMLAACGGALLSTGLSSYFVEDMVAGRGYIALATVVFGKYSPLGVVGAALLFSLGETIQITLQASGSDIAPSILMMFPYILTLIALAGFIGKSIAPSSVGEPYARG